MKKLFLSLLVAIMAVSMVAVFSLSGCKAEEAAEEEAVEEVEETAEEEAVEDVTKGFDKKLKIWIIVSHLDAFHTAVYDNLELIAEEENFEVTMFNRDDSLEKLQNCMEDAIQVKPDGLIFAPDDPDSVTPQIDSLKEAGVAVIAYDSYQSNCTTVLISNYEAAKLGGTAAAEYWEEHFPGIEPKCAYFGKSWIPHLLERETGFLDGFRTIYPDFDWYAKGDALAGGDTVKLGADFYEDTFQAKPDTNFIYALSDDIVGPGVGVLQSLGRGTSDKELAVGYDGNEEACISIKDPQNCWKLTVGQPPKRQATESWNALKKLMMGEELPEMINFKGIIITAENADEWLEEQYLISPEEQAK